MTEPIELDAPEFLIPGALGPPGRRVFYLQGRQGAVLLSLRLEKQQVAAMATYLGELLTELPAAGDVGAHQEVLEEPFDPAWVVGSIGVGYRDDVDRIVVALEELTPVVLDEDDEIVGSDGDDVRRANVQLTRGQAVHFVALATQLVSSGRPPCPLCGKPVDPEGHACIKSNGHGHT